SSRIASSSACLPGRATSHSRRAPTARSPSSRTYRTRWRTVCTSSRSKFRHSRGMPCRAGRCSMPRSGSVSETNMSADELTLAAARARDAADPLAGFRREFALPRDARGEPLVYLCGHSLGPMPLAARELVLEELDDWARLGVLGHEAARRPWIDYAEPLQRGLAALTGARPGEVVAMSSLTINLHLMLASFYRP